MTHQLNNGHIAVVTPEGSIDFEIYDKETLQMAVMCYKRIKMGDSTIKVPTPVIIPPGSYTIIGRASELTEEQAKEVVEKEDKGFMYWYLDYDSPFNFCTLRSAIESISSFCRSIGAEPENVLILKSEK